MSSQLILVVDDEALIGLLVEDYLETAGYDVIVATSAEEAISLLALGGEPAALITDVRLPGMSGWELARHIRHLHPGIAVIYISGDSAHAWSKEGVTNSAMLAKPFAMTELRDTLTALLRGASAASG